MTKTNYTWIRKKLQKRGIGGSEMARAIGVSPSYITQLAAGTNGYNPKPEIQAKIDEFFTICHCCGQKWPDERDTDTE